MEPEGSVVSGTWPTDFKDSHINLLELRAVLWAISHWSLILRGQEVMVATDNTTVYPFPVSFRPSLGTFHPLQATGGFPQGQTYPGQGQYSGRPPLQIPLPSTDGTVSGTGSGQSLSVNILVRGNRSVRFQSQSQTPPLRLSSPRPESMGSGCDVIQLGAPTSICLPTIQSHSLHLSQDQVVGMQNSVDSPSVATQKLVQFTVVSTVGQSQSTATETRPSITGKRQATTSGPTVSCSSRMAVIRHSIRERKFSHRVADIVSQARRPSTRNVYQSRWCIFTDWCISRQIDPISASMSQIADFLIFLFSDKKLSMSSVKGYRVMLSNTLKFRSGRDIGHDPVISEVIRSLELQRPVTRSLTPRWNLTCVLWSLCKAPYEPLSRSDMTSLTYKTVFLLAFATAKNEGVKYMHYLLTQLV